MNLNAQFLALDEKQKTVFLTRLSYELTIVFRDFASRDNISAEQRSHLLYGVNELQHRLSAQLGKYARQDDSGFPDEVILPVVLEMAQNYGMEKLIESTAERIMEKEQ
jgi:hypothetical protein